MSKTPVIVRPKRRTLPLLEVWEVTRYGQVFTLQCVEGGFYDAYRQKGYDPYLDLELGRTRRKLVRTIR